MNGTERMLSRRTVLTGLGALGLASIHCGPASAVPGPVLTKPIPSTGEP
jgi:hypothetical protein